MPISYSFHKYTDEIYKANNAQYWFGCFSSYSDWGWLHWCQSSTILLNVKGGMYFIQRAIITLNYLHYMGRSLRLSSFQTSDRSFFKILILFRSAFKWTVLLWYAFSSTSPILWNLISFSSRQENKVCCRRQCWIHCHISIVGRDTLLILGIFRSETLIFVQYRFW